MSTAAADMVSGVRSFRRGMEGGSSTYLKERKDNAGKDRENRALRTDVWAGEQKKRR